MSTKKKQEFDYITYGATVKPGEVHSILDHLYDNFLIKDSDKRPTPLCIWGMHGIGKTQIVKDFAADKGCGYAFLSSAQIEEVGDLIGFPMMEEKDGKKITRYATPEWVPMEEGPGILLIDDFNRSDDRIIRALMNVLQNYEMVSWKIPDKWMIVLTANPDGGDYSVTSVDDAVLTRMIHVTMDFDVKDWARWAEKNNILPTGIEFVLSYPEVVTGGQTTPRTLVQFFESIKNIEDMHSKLPLILLLAKGSLDEYTAKAFTTYIDNVGQNLISPEEILFSFPVQTTYYKIRDIVNEDILRLDILSVIMTRLTNYILFKTNKLDSAAIERLTGFLKFEFIPNDLRINMINELIKSNKEELKLLAGEPEIAELILEGL